MQSLRPNAVRPFGAQKPKRPKQPKPPRPQVIHDIYNVSITDIMRMAGRGRGDPKLKEELDDLRFNYNEMEKSRNNFATAYQWQKNENSTAFNSGLMEGLLDTRLYTAVYPDGEQRFYTADNDGKKLLTDDINSYLGTNMTQSTVTKRVDESHKGAKEKRLTDYQKLLASSEPASLADLKRLGEYDHATNRGFEFFKSVNDAKGTGVSISRPLTDAQLIAKYGIKVGPQLQLTNWQKSSIDIYLSYPIHKEKFLIDHKMVRENRAKENKLRAELSMTIDASDNYLSEAIAYVKGKDAVRGTKLDRAKSNENARDNSGRVKGPKGTGTPSTPSTPSTPFHVTGTTVRGMPNFFTPESGSLAVRTASPSRLPPNQYLQLSGPAAIGGLSPDDDDDWDDIDEDVVPTPAPMTPTRAHTPSATYTPSATPLHMEGIQLFTPGSDTSIGGVSTPSPQVSKRKSTRRVSSGIKRRMSIFEPPLESVGSPSPVKIGRTMTLREWRNTPPSSGMNLMERKSTPKKKTPTPG